MEIHFQTTDHVVAVEKVAEQQTKVSFRISRLEIRPLLREPPCIQNNMAAPLMMSPHKNKGIFLSTRSAGLYNSNKYLMLRRLLQDIRLAIIP